MEIEWTLPKLTVGVVTLFTASDFILCNGPTILVSTLKSLPFSAVRFWVSAEIAGSVLTSEKDFAHVHTTRFVSCKLLSLAHTHTHTHTNTPGSVADTESDKPPNTRISQRNTTGGSCLIRKHCTKCFLFNLTEFQIIHNSKNLVYRKFDLDSQITVCLIYQIWIRKPCL